MSRARVQIVIVNFRTAQLTIESLRSIADEIASVPARVTVVDSASGNSSADTIAAAIAREGWGPWVSVMRLDANGGFAFGNNAAIAPTLKLPDPPDYVLLLNPDTIVRAGAIYSLVEFMEAHPRVGIGGSRLENPDGSPQRSAFRFPTLWGELEAAMRFGPVTKLLQKYVVAPPVTVEACRADWVCGASMIVRREVFQDIGLLDDRYFMYYEEVDFCRRARRRGWKCWYVPRSRVVHLVGQSSGFREGQTHPPRRPAYWFESRRHYFQKNHGRFYAILADVAWMTGFILWRVRRVVQRKPDTDPPRMLRDFVRHSSLIYGA